MKPSLGPLSTVAPDDRLRLLLVALVGCALIALETISFQTLVFVNEYLAATQVIALALMGIALGGLLSFFVRAEQRDAAVGVLTVLYPLALLGSFPVIIRLNPYPLVMLPLLTLPYVVASMIISITFNRLKPSLVYLFDLGGAGVGALVAVLAIPWLREEGSFALLGVLGAAPIALHWRVTRRRGFLAAALAVGGASLGLLVVQVAADPFNMVFTATANKQEYPQKIFLSRALNDPEIDPRERLKYSRGSLMERIDIEEVRKKRGSKWARYYYRTWYNGRPNDHVSRDPKKKKGRLDRRLPTRLKLGQNPDTLLVGPAAEGLTKTVKALGDGHIDAVEINPAVADLMLNELYKFSAKAYDGMDLTIGDVRTFLKRTDRKYDFITLLNTHRIRTVGHEGPPEYCHTIEAMRDYLDHLTPEGYIVFEERNVNERADLGIRRILRTMIAALRERGVADPTRHFVVYEFPACGQVRKCPRGNLYTMVMAKRSPVTDAEYAHLKEWGEEIGLRGVKDKERARKLKHRRPSSRGIDWRYLPQERPNNLWTAAIEAADIYQADGVEPTRHNMGVVTDDQPFPYDVFKTREKPLAMLKQTAWLSLVMVLLPAVVTFVARRRRAEQIDRSAGSPVLANLLLLLYFGVLGIAYLLIEIVLLQKFQMFLASPVYALVIVLGTMLIASGIGGYYSGGVTKRGALVALLLVVAITVLAYLGLGAVLDGLMFLPFALRVVVAMVLIAPLAFLMGVPFPYAMAVAKRRLTERHAGLMFGINGAVAAVASPLAIVLSMTRGFGFTMLVGGAAYLVALALIALVRPGADALAAAPPQDGPG